MKPEVKEVGIVSNTGIEKGVFKIWEESPANRNKVRLELLYDGEEEKADAETFFEALLQIRAVLEIKGRLIKCYGASRNVYPSGMHLSMGTGEFAFKLKMGMQSRQEDEVSIFDMGPDVEPCSIQDQKAFSQAWIKSISRNK